MWLMLIVEETINGIATPAGTGAELLINTAVLWLILIAEIIAAVLIGVGIFLTLAGLVKARSQPRYRGYERARLALARFLTLALEFQLAADVLATAVAPSWTQIGKLGAIAVIRTALNYFLAREIKEEERATSVAVVGSDA